MFDYFHKIKILFFTFLSLSIFSATYADDTVSPIFDKIILTSNNPTFTSTGTSYVKAWDLLYFNLYLSEADTWAIWNNLEFIIWTKPLITSYNFNFTSTPTLSGSVFYKVVTWWINTVWDQGEIEIKNLNFFDEAWNEIIWFNSPYIAVPHIIADAKFPYINFNDDVELWPVSSDTINIDIIEENPDIESYKYTFSDQDKCYLETTYSNSFTSWISFNIDNEINNWKYICVQVMDIAWNISYLSSKNTLNIININTDTDLDWVPDIIEINEWTDLNNAWDFLDIDWDTVSNYLDNDDDNDGLYDKVENNAPNSWDANYDWILDSLQLDVSSLVNPITNNYVTLDLENSDSKCNILVFNILDENNLINQDIENNYPVWLNNFVLNCTNPWDIVSIKIYYDDLYDTSDWVYKKYNEQTNTYTDMSSIVEFSTENFSWKEITTVNYDIADWWIYDEDWIINWTVVDPSGPSIIESTEINLCEILPWNKIKKIKISQIVNIDIKNNSLITIWEQYVECWDEYNLDKKTEKKFNKNLEKYFSKLIKKIEKIKNDEKRKLLINQIFLNLKIARESTNDIYITDIIDYIENNLKTYY